LNWRQTLTDTSQPENSHQNEGNEDLETVNAVVAMARFTEGTGGAAPPNSSLPVTYCIAKTPSVRNVTVHKITTQYQAQSFLADLSKYLLSITPRSSIMPSPLDRFDVYKQISIPIGPIPAVAQGTVDRIRAVAAPTPSNIQPASISRFDVALLKYDADNEHTKGTALEGLRIAQVRVLFDLPAHFLPESSTLQTRSTPTQLAYVEWFKPFHHRDLLTGMFRLSRAMRSGLPLSEIVPLDRIVGSVHLVPRFGTTTDRRWSHNSVLEQCSSFLLNDWISLHVFYQMRQCT
jgi:hypothetical protein